MSTDRTFYYFAFGSNLSTKRIRKNCESAKAVHVGKVDKYKLDFGHHSTGWQGAVATITPDPREAVYGVIWEIEQKHKKSLDQQEGVHRKIYREITVEVAPITQKGLGKKIRCVSYVLEQDKFQNGNHLPTPAYKDTIIRGAKEHRLPQVYIKRLESLRDNGSRHPGPL